MRCRIRFKFTRRTVEGAKNCPSPSTSSVVESDKVEASIPSDDNLELPSAHVRLIDAIIKALDRQRDIEAGKKVARDNLNWWRNDKRNKGKLVLDLDEKCKDMFKPFKYPNLVMAPPRVTITSRSAITATTTADAPPGRSKRGRKASIFKRIMLFLLLFVLLIANVTSLTLFVLVMMF